VVVAKTVMRWRGIGFGLLVALLGSASAADDAAPAQPKAGSGAAGSEPAAGEPAPAPPVAYDALFKLPDTGTVPAPSEAATLDRKRWEERFAAVRGDVDTAKADLAKSQAQLESMARKTENWQMAAPGAAQQNAENSPVSYKLRQDIRRQREDVDRAERRLRELEVEASLAGVPPEWRTAPAHEDAVPAPAPAPEAKAPAD
jgi:hypothetical protein